MLASREWRNPRSRSYYQPEFDWFCSDLGLIDSPIWQNEPAQREQLDAMAEMIDEDEWVMNQARCQRRDAMGDDDKRR